MSHPMRKPAPKAENPDQVMADVSAAPSPPLGGEEAQGTPAVSGSAFSLQQVSDALPKTKGKAKASAPEDLQKLYDDMSKTLEMRKQQTAREELLASQKTVAAALQQQRDALAAAQKVQQGKRQRDPSPPGVSSKTAKVEDLINFNAIVNPAKKPKCAFQIKGGPMIGNPFNATNGYSVHFAIDGGRYGQPSIGLDIKVNVTNKSVPTSEKVDTEHEAVAWYPGVKVFDQYMMTSLKVANVIDHGSNRLAFPDEIMNMVKREGYAPNLRCIKFSSNTHVTRRQNRDAWKGLDDNVKMALEQLFCNTDVYVISIWFVAPYAGKHFEETCLNYFTRAWEMKLPPLHQYMNSTGRLILDLEDTEPILTFKDGMYCNWPKNKFTSKPDKSGLPTSYYVLPKKIVWETLPEFCIYGALTVIRESQFVKGKMVHIQFRPHRVFLQSLPSLALDERGIYTVNKSKLTESQKLFRNCAMAYIRQTPTKDGIKEASPPDGSRVRLDWDNSGPGKAHNPSKRSDWWFGDVIRRDPSELRATGTDFCVFLTKPGHAAERVMYEDLMKLKDGQLKLAHIEVIYDDEAASRELKAIKEFSNMGPQNPRLDATRQSLISTPASRAFVMNDVTLGVPPTEKHRMEYLKYYHFWSKKIDNPQQMNVLNAPRAVRDKLSVCVGAPGSGKTYIQALQSYGLMKGGHKIGFFGPSNVSVDTVATAFWKHLPLELKGKKFLRLETNSTEKRNILKDKNYMDWSQQDVNQPRAMKSSDASVDWKKDPEYQHWFSENMSFIKELTEGQQNFDKVVDPLKLLDQFKTKGEAWKEAYERIEQLGSETASTYPAGMTLGYRVAEAISHDRRIAEERYAEERAKYTGPDLDQFRSEHSVDDYDKSYLYTMHMNNFIAKEGRLSGDARDAFDKIRNEMIVRVIRESDGVFATANNAGSDILAKAFDPTIICFDEAGQAPIPNFCVPLTVFKNWQAVFLYGDPKQLEPMATAFSGSEVAANAKVSPLSLLVTKGFPHILLNTCYRMCPQLLLWPSQQFYAGNLICHASAHADNPIRKTMREISQQHYGIEGENRNGSEYWVVDVAYGMSRLEINGTSMQNYANADAIAEAIGHLVRHGIPASKISILTFYKGQKSVIMSKIEEQHKIKEDTTAENEDDAQGLLSWKLKDVATVDAYHGQENDVLLVDLVTAYEKSPFQAEVEENEELFDYESQPHGKSKKMPREMTTKARVSAHARNPNRLNVSLTRGKSGLIVFTQAATILGSVGAEGESRARNALPLMFQNAWTRGLTYRDLTHLDTHPTALAYQKKVDMKAALHAEQHREVYKLGFIGEMIRRAHRFTNKPENDDTVPYYRTHKGDVTRVSGPADLLQKANEQDAALDKGSRKGAVVDPQSERLDYNKYVRDLQKTNERISAAIRAAAAKAKGETVEQTASSSTTTTAVDPPAEFWQPSKASWDTLGDWSDNEEPEEGLDPGEIREPSSQMDTSHDNNTSGGS